MFPLPWTVPPGNLRKVDELWCIFKVTPDAGGQHPAVNLKYGNVCIFFCNFVFVPFGFSFVFHVLFFCAFVFVCGCVSKVTPDAGKQHPAINLKYWDVCIFSCILEFCVACFVYFLLYFDASSKFQRPMAAKILVDFQHPSSTKAVRGCVRKSFIFLDKKCSYTNTHNTHTQTLLDNDTAWWLKKVVRGKVQNKK